MVKINPQEVLKEFVRPVVLKSTVDLSTENVAHSLQSLRQETSPNEAKRRTINEKLSVLRQQNEEKQKEMKEIDTQLLAVAEEQRSALLEKKKSSSLKSVQSRVSDLRHSLSSVSSSRALLIVSSIPQGELWIIPQGELWIMLKKNH